MKAYLDSNIILDVLDENRLCHEDSGMIIEFAKDFSNILELVVSVQSMIDAYYIVQRQKTGTIQYRNFANWCVNHINVRPIGLGEYYEALDSDEKDIEDSSQIALAQTEHCEVFITSDKEILKRGKDNYLLYLSPSDFIARMSEA